MMHEVRQYADEVLDLANEHGFPLWAAGARFYRGVASSSVGEGSESVSLMTQAWEQNRGVGQVLTSPRALAYLAEGHATLGHPAEGLSKLREAQELIETTHERHHEAEVHRLRGDLLRMIDDQLAAERNYNRALAVAKRQNTRTHELRAAMSMVRLWRDEARSGPRTTRSDLRLVHRRLRYAGFARREGLARRTAAMSMARLRRDQDLKEAGVAR
jgi:tetratricopeptide (TPR) repeat protein